MANDECEMTMLEAVRSNSIKCIRCIEAYLQVPDGPPKAGAWEAVNDAITYAPMWQTTMAGPNQMVMACVTVPVCLDHIQIQKQTVEQIASRNGLELPGLSLG